MSKERFEKIISLLPAPYYKDDWCAIYHGDCRELLPLLPDKSSDLVLTDPPYGIGAGREKPHNGWVDYGISDWDLQTIDKVVFNLIIDKSVNQIIWGGNYYADYLYPTMGWLVWDKGQRDFSLADGELAWTSYNKALRIINVPRGRALQDGKVHPTQKSVEVIKKCINYSALESGIILDPMSGSFTTIFAAKQYNLYSIGIEIEEKYCEIAAKRCSQQVMELSC